MKIGEMNDLHGRHFTCVASRLRSVDDADMLRVTNHHYMKEQCETF